MLRPIAIFLGGLLTTTSALAGADLETTLSGPGSVPVDVTHRFDVTVDNVGDRDARGVEVEIQLPETSTSPTVHVMGVLGSTSSTCTQSGTVLTCTMGKIRKGTAKTRWFDISFPHVDGGVTIAASATTITSESNTGNNADTFDPNLAYTAVAYTTPVSTVIEHCTGTDLTSFYECELSPTSISSHATTLNADGSITFVPAQPGYTGNWTSASADELQFTYYYLGSPVADFDGRGVDTDCWEGLTTFASAFVSPYRVCVQ